MKCERFRNHCGVTNYLNSPIFHQLLS